MTDSNKVLTDTNIAWTRTTVNALWLGVLVWANARFGWGIDFDTPWTIVIVGVSAGIVWRISELLSKIPYLGYVLFAINKEPSYSPLPPPAGTPLPQEDAGIVNDNVIWSIVGILAIVALAIWIIPRLG